MKKRLKKILILTVILGICIAGIAGFFILNSAPDKFSEAEKEKAVAEILGRKPNLNPDIKTGNSLYEGKKLAFNYPARAKIYEYESPGTKNNNNTLDRFSFDIERPRLILNYTAVSKPSLNNITDEPAVNLREQKARGYKKEEVQIDGVSGNSYRKEMSGESRAEHSAFILRDGVLYTISVTGVSLEDINVLFDQIINSAEFQ